MEHKLNKCFAKLLLRAALVALLCASVAVALVALVACAQTDETAPAPPPFYSPESFSLDGQFYRYVEDGVLAHKTGVDVSDHQDWIDWEAVKQDGIQFAYIRAGYRGSTEGELYEDEYFAYNMAGTKEAGIERGVYFFSQALTEAEAREEAEFVLQLLGGQALDYPVAFDFEQSAQGIQSRVAGLSSEEASRIARAFCGTIQAGGYECCLYGNGHDLGRYDEALLDTWPLWYAEYGALPAYTNEYFLWQYSSTGTVSGIDSDVDLNLDFSTILENN